MSRRPAFLAFVLLAGCANQAEAPMPPLPIPYPIARLGTTPRPCAPMRTIEIHGCQSVAIETWSGGGADTLILPPGYFTVQMYDSVRVLDVLATARALDTESERRAAR